MSTRAYVSLFKVFSGLAGAIGASVLIGFPALAASETGVEQSNEASTAIAQAPAEVGVELSDEGLEILCERFPLNSRCSGTASPEELAPVAEPSTPSDDLLEPEADASGDGFMESEGSASEEGFIEPEADSSFSEPIDEMEPSTLPPSSTPPQSMPLDAAPMPTAPSSKPSSVLPEESAPTETMEPEALAPTEEAPVELAQDDPTPPTPEAVSPEATTPASETAVPEADSSTEPTLEPTTPEADGSTSSASITSEELQQVANIIPQLQQVEQTAQQQLTETIEASGLTEARFGELFQAQQLPDAALASEATPEEQQSFEQVLTELQTIQQDVQAQQEEIVIASGLAPERFSQILDALRQDPGLQQQVQQMIQE